MRCKNTNFYTFLTVPFPFYPILSITELVMLAMLSSKRFELNKFMLKREKQCLM